MTEPTNGHQPPNKSGEGWAIGIAIWLVFFVISLIGFVLFASLQNRDLVESSYYERGLEYGDRIDEMERSTAAGDVVLDLATSTKQLTVTLPIHETAPEDVSGELLMYRPSDATLDISFPLALDDFGRQTFDLQSLDRGLWKVKLSWTVDGERFYHEETLFVP